jgi:hypothetical protein
MAPSTSFADLDWRLEEGDEQGATLIGDRYSFRLIGVAHRQLDRRPRGQVGLGHIVQPAFRRAVHAHFDLDVPNALSALLAETTLGTPGRWSRHFAARKRGGVAKCGFSTLRLAISASVPAALRRYSSARWTIKARPRRLPEDPP